MRKLFSLFFVALLSFSSLQAQRADFELSITPAVEGEIKVFVQPLTAGGGERAMQLHEKDGKYVGKVPVSASGFYNVVAICNNRQLITTAYVVLGEDNIAVLPLRMQGNTLLLDNTAENSALTVLNARMTDFDRALWTGTGLSSDELKAIVGGYGNVLDSLTKSAAISEDVAGYMKVWAFARAYNAYASIPRAQNVDSIGFGVHEVLPAMEKALDNDYTPLFPMACQMIASTIPSGGLLERMEALHAFYKNDVVREKVSASLLALFLSEHDYASDFEGGISLLKQAVEKYGLSGKYVEEYIRRKATIAGSPFPSDIVLEDANGNVVDFSTFKGKYVYIDLWASWCGPCRKEVPHLQALEAGLENSNVVFLSISTDTDTDAWKKSMAELNMHGHQLHDRDNRLCNALNIKGIPFFLIYDKEGNLHTYRAMRPSRGEQLKSFLESLK